MPGCSAREASSDELTRCALAPVASPALVEAILAGGGRLVDVASAEALVWTDPLDVDSLAAVLSSAPHLRWVQLPFAGVDRFASVLDADRTWTSAKGAYARPVAEHALALGLAGLRGLPSRARARRWGPPAGRQLMGGRVTLVGGGAITEVLLRLLVPFQVEATVVRRHVSPLPRASHVVGAHDLLQALPGAVLVVLTLALTDETRGVIGTDALARMDGDAWLVNVARGEHVVTEALIAALEQEVIGGAALDVTDPEPLPEGHRLWELDNCLVTPHVANTPEMAEPLLAERVRGNVERYRARQPLLGVVDPVLGY
ncbi:MAG: D-isomer specific 2-hydroxyacid dehydrogenase family protein [Actinomycetota bacterium]|nr:D-isomer specific 2-hydroxyacid dehydrogenase family protein [Actinomycetota bacterium]